MTNLVNKIVPGFADWYLSQNGYKSQQTDEPEDPNRPYNLWEPVPGDFGAYGDFDNRSSNDSWQLWATTHRPLVALALAGIGLAAYSAYFAFSNEDGKEGEHQESRWLLRRKNR